VFFVYRLGPIVTAEGTAAYYLGYVDGKHDITLTECPPDDEAALRTLAKKYAASTLACPDSLAEAGGPLGYRSLPIPPDVLIERAGVAVKAALSGTQNEASIASCVELVAASAVFYAKKPWMRWEDRILPIEIDDEDEVLAHDLSMLGQEGEALISLVISDHGEFARGLGLPSVEPAIAILGVNLQDNPPFAVDAVREAFGMRKCPKVAFGIEGKALPIDSLQHLTLAAALRAAAASVETKSGKVTREARSGQMLVRATIELPRR
jgi:hypothetical protein